MTLKNITDNIFKMTPEFVNELNKSITKLLSNLSKEVLGYEIDNNNKLFQEKIKQVVNSVENSIENIVVFLNPKDFEAIKVYNNKNNLSLSFEINQDANLERGERVRWRWHLLQLHAHTCLYAYPYMSICIPIHVYMHTHT